MSIPVILQKSEWTNLQSSEGLLDCSFVFIVCLFVSSFVCVDGLFVYSSGFCFFVFCFVLLVCLFDWLDGWFDVCLLVCLLVLMSEEQ